MITVAKTAAGAASADVSFFFDDKPQSIVGCSVFSLASSSKVNIAVSDNVEKMEQETPRELVESFDTLPEAPDAIQACGCVTIRKGAHVVTVAAWKMPLAVHTDEEASAVAEYILGADGLMRARTPSTDVVHVIAADMGVNVLPVFRATFADFVVSGDAVDGVWYVYEDNTRFSVTKPHDNLYVAPVITNTREWCLMDFIYGFFK